MHLNLNPKMNSKYISPNGRAIDIFDDAGIQHGDCYHETRFIPGGVVVKIYRVYTPSSIKDLEDVLNSDAELTAIYMNPGDLAYLIKMTVTNAEFPEYSPIQLFPIKSKCECGAASCGSKIHSDWCPEK